MKNERGEFFIHLPPELCLLNGVEEEMRKRRPKKVRLGGHILLKVGWGDPQWQGVAKGDGF